MGAGGVALGKGGDGAAAVGGLDDLHELLTGPAFPVPGSERSRLCGQGS